MEDIIYIDIITEEPPAAIEIIAEEPSATIEIVTSESINVIEINTGDGSETPYVKVLTGTSITVLQAEHLLTLVRGIRVYNSITGEIIETAEIILNNNVTINSNFDLTNYSLMIY